mmetsp:Transcript_56127/g.122158  ORF Transcript_56127/g.122158 Transcript_56127/m.122158 type:complete len:210 (+) Transcript_56127:180-809(+)
MWSAPSPLPPVRGVRAGDLDCWRGAASSQKLAAEAGLRGADPAPLSRGDTLGASGTKDGRGVVLCTVLAIWSRRWGGRDLWCMSLDISMSFHISSVISMRFRTVFASLLFWLIRVTASILLAMPFRARQPLMNSSMFSFPDLSSSSSRKRPVASAVSSPRWWSMELTSCWTSSRSKNSSSVIVPDPSTSIDLKASLRVFTAFSYSSCSA